MLNQQQIIIEDVEQGTEAWHQLKIGVISGSSIKALGADAIDDPLETEEHIIKLMLDKHFKRDGLRTYMYKLISEISTGQREDMYKSFAMDRGNEREPQARELFELQELTPVKQVGFIYKDDTKKCGISPDGLIGDDGLIEIKCPLSKEHTRTMVEGRIKKDYIAQIQYSFWVTGRKYCKFISYDSDDKYNKLHVIDVEPCPIWQRKYDVIVPEFIKRMDLIKKHLGITDGS